MEAVIGGSTVLEWRHKPAFSAAKDVCSLKNCRTVDSLPQPLKSSKNVAKAWIPFWKIMVSR